MSPLSTSKLKTLGRRKRSSILREWGIGQKGERADLTNKMCKMWGRGKASRAKTSDQPGLGG